MVRLEKEPDTEVAAMGLRDRALTAGGRDNITIVLIDILDDGEKG